jgi:hypothetical protein
LTRSINKLGFDDLGGLVVGKLGVDHCPKRKTAPEVSTSKKGSSSGLNISNP